MVILINKKNSIYWGIVFSLMVSLSSCNTKYLFNKQDEFLFCNEVTSVIDTSWLLPFSRSNSNFDIKTLSDKDGLWLKEESSGALIKEELKDVISQYWYGHQWDLFYDGYTSINDTLRIKSNYISYKKNLVIMKVIGEIEIDDNFNSYLIILDQPKTNETDYYINKSILLFNVKEHKIVSMVEMCSLFQYMSSPICSYTEMKRKGVFRKRIYDYGNSKSFRLPETWFIQNPTKGVKYHFDKTGRLVMQ